MQCCHVEAVRATWPPCTRIHTHTHTHTPHAYTHTHTHTPHLHSHTHTRTHTHTHTDTHTHTHTTKNTKNTHTHTHTHNGTNAKKKGLLIRKRKIIFLDNECTDRHGDNSFVRNPTRALPCSPVTKGTSG